MNFGVRIFYLIKNYSFHSELDRFVTNDDYVLKKHMSYLTRMKYRKNRK